MSDSPAEGQPQLSPVKRALLALEQVQAKLAASERARTEPLAIVGMACRFPGGADDPESFWRLLRDGVDAISEVPRDRWDVRAYLDPDPDAPGKMVTRWGGFLDGVDRVDADFFGISPREAESMDPQQRLLLEVAWHALEGAGQNVDRLAGSRTGVFVGLSSSDYLILQCGDPSRINPYFGTGLNASVAAGRLSYLLGLQGPSLTLDTACSSSLVAVHLACRSLRNRESDLALAAGVQVILSPVNNIYASKIRAAAADGRCKSFDAAADGYVRSEGCGVVVLKRLSDALAAGDPILALVRGSAVNHDGRSNGLTAPNGLAQQALLRQALRDAGVTPDRIAYVEAHGSGTPLGDPIEARALAAVLGEGRPPGSRVAIGSVKSNIGHLEAAAGVAGLIKTVQVLRHREIPASLHFATPNPEIPFDRTCLRVQDRLGPWPEGTGPALAGVSSFGFSGTNAHVVLEEAPPPEPSGPSRPWQLLLLSARTGTALEVATEALAGWLERRPEARLADVAFTCQAGRKRFGHRRALVCRDREDALAALRSRDRARLLDGVEERDERAVGFLFPGLGDQYPGMARGLYRTEPGFREVVDRCAELLWPELGVDLREVLLAAVPDEDREAAPQAGPDLRRLLGRGEARSAEGGPLSRTSIAQPAVFVAEYALARLLMEWGLRPQAMLGHSLGEYVAACLAGVFSLEDGLRLVAARARLIEESPPGAMLAVPWSPAELAPYLSGALSLAAVNAPAVCVAAGPLAGVLELEARLAAQGVACRRLQTAHAFHSSLMEPLVERFVGLVRGVELREPALRYVSNVTGRWIEAFEATDPQYWGRHLRGTVQFSAGVAELASDPDLALVEVGPGQTLSSFVRQHPAAGAGRVVVPALRHEHTPERDEAFLLTALGRLWLAGVEVDWQGFARYERRRRLALPVYPFERRRFWMEPAAEAGAAPVPPTRGKWGAVEEWFYRPVWERAPLRGGTAGGEGAGWLLFDDGRGMGAALAARLEAAGATVTRVAAGEGFREEPDGSFRLRPGQRKGYRRLVERLLARGPLPGRIVHLWGAAGEGAALDAELEAGFYSVLWLAQALLAGKVTDPVEISVVTCGVQPVAAADRPRPGRAAVLGPVRVIPQEVPSFLCRSIDLPADPRDGGEEPERLAELLAAELLGRAQDPAVAWRGGERWVQGFAPAGPAGGEGLDLRPGGVCLITGGLGGIGLILAEHLARERGARLVLVGRSRFPAREEWEDWLAGHAPDDPVSRKIRRLHGIEELGGEVLVLSADAADAGRMREVVAAAESRFGGLHAVIHAAGVLSPEHFAGVADLGPETCELHFRPKVRGMLALEEALGGRDLDFRLLFSSLSSVLGGLGFSAYAAANLALDAFAHARSRAGTPWLSVCWDPWDVGEGSSLALGATLAELAMTPEEGAAAFAHALRLGAGPQLVHSTGDLQARIDQWVGRRALRSAPREPGAALYARPELQNAFVPGSNELERTIAGIWGGVLGLERVGVDDNFFELGGNSLVGMQVIAELGRKLGVQISTVALFAAPTVRKLAELLSPPGPAPETEAAPVAVSGQRGAREAGGTRDIAIIGMAGRFPGARDLEELWSNLRDGRETITFFTDEELAAAGVDRALLADPSYVRARPVLEGAELFDARLFGYSPREAELTDPQQRVFLECAWEALENAGYDPQRFRGAIGMFAGSSLSSYLLTFHGHPEVMKDPYQLVIGHDKDSLPTNVSYRLNLTGPSLAVQTHCSTSMVAVHVACQSLLAGESDMALAGGVSIRFPQKVGHLYQPGGMECPDGHCRTFDAAARGTLFGDGVGVVVLKRLADALADGDDIRAVIKGTAINNDGSLKVGYAAPSVEGQAKAVATALANAGVSADTISYVEAHGTATELGDPIEVAALTRAFRATTDRKGSCAIGSVKTNIGHLDRAAGISGLVKTVLALEHRQIPASLHFREPNPQIDFANSPFYVNTRLSEWPANGGPRRAAVNSLGMGGTNAHAILEEAPAVEPSGPSRPWKLLLLSAKTATALEATTGRLASALAGDPEVEIADVAYTLQVGRRALEHRRVVLCEAVADAVEALSTLDPRRVFTHEHEPRSRTVVFLFPGLGDHYAGMGAELYRTEAVFREHVDRCAEILRPLLGLDLRDVLLVPDAGGEPAAPAGLDLRRMLGRGAAEEADPLRPTSLAQPALFVVEHALARLWMSWGVRPHAMIGYSLGEYVAACLAGVLSLEDALTLIARRALLLEELPAGAMLAVPLPADEARALLGEGLSLAAINGPAMSVVAGPPEVVAELAARLLGQGIACRPIQTSHAFHSTMMEPLAGPLSALLSEVELAPPRIPYLSNVTGTWISPAEATDPGYWVRHLCGTVRFDDGLRELLREPDRVLLEVGPGQALGSLALQHRDGQALVLASLRHRYDRQPDLAFLLSALGRLWLAGVPIDWEAFRGGERRHRLRLPTYPFERQRYWLEPVRSAAAEPRAAGKEPDLADWFYVPAWKQVPAGGPARSAGAGEEPAWLLFLDELGLGAWIADVLRRDGRRVATVARGDAFVALEDGSYTLDPRRREHYQSLVRALRDGGGVPRRIVHLWTADPLPEGEPCDLGECLDLGFHSLIFLAQALAGEERQGLAIDVVSSGLHAVTGDERLVPERATVVGPCRVIPQEYPHIACRNVDLAAPEGGAAWPQRTAALLLRQVQEWPAEPCSEPVIALRGAHRWVPVYERRRLEEPAAPAPRLREGGVYLITGGLGGIGLALAEHLARTERAKLVLVGRSGLPPRPEWRRLAGAAGDDGASRKVRAVLALEELGSEVLVLAADVADRAQMREALDLALGRFGTLHGVIHAAGVPGAGLIELKTPEAAARVLAPKVQGTLVLDALLEPLELDFLVLFSSVSAIAGGGPGQVDYCAANAFLDAFAHSRSARGGLTVAVDWSEWQWDAWQENLLGIAPEIQDFLRENRKRFGITFDEGARALRRVLTAGLPQVVVSTQELRSLLELARSFTSELLSRFETARKSSYPRPVLGTLYAPPATGLERRLAALWEEALGIDEVGRHDDFFELGGHSLLATQLFWRLRDVFAVDLPLRSIFEAPTLEGLAALIEEAQRGSAGAPPRQVLPPIGRASRERPLPLSFAQQRLWFLDQLAPGSPLYNDPSAFRLRGRLDRAALGRALDEIERRHEILRTTFPATDGRPVQVVHPASGLALPLVDLTALPPGGREALADRLAREEAQRPFELARGPLVRSALLRLDAEEHLLLFMTHHIVNDGWSGGVIGRELAALYAAFLAGRPSPLPELPIQYADFAAWQRSWLQGEGLERQLAYWRERLYGELPALALPTDRPRPAVPSYRGAGEAFALPDGLARAFSELSREQGGSLFMTLLAGLLAFLHRLTGACDIVVGTDIAGRTRSELEPLIGFFVNILPLRTDLGGDPPFRQLVERVREVALGAYAHQDLPFDKLVEELQPERSLGAAPLFRVLFVLQNAAGGTVELPGVTLAPYPVDSGAAKFDLAVIVSETEAGGLEGVFRYSTDLFDRGTVQRMAARFAAHLQSAAARPDARLSRLDMLTEPERTKRAMDTENRQSSGAGKPRFARRSAVDLSQVSLVRMGPLAPGRELPLLIEPATEDVDLIDWAKHNRQRVEERLLEHGALLFRGFGIASTDDFERFTRTICPDLFGGYGDLPREAFGGDIYGSTPYPPDKVILFHNESSQMHHWPLKQWFYCVTPAQQGGETPIADGREIYRRLPVEVREPFERKGVMYVRNFADGLDVDWQEFFRTTDRSVVEGYCRKAQIECEWRGSGLTTRKVNPAVARHPKTGETVFFNQIQAHHISCLEPEVRESLLSLFGEEGLPRNVYFGDGSPISAEQMDQVRRTYDEVAVSFPWRQGDILMVDNMLTAHSRNAYVGPRKIVVAMGEMVPSAGMAPQAG